MFALKMGEATDRESTTEGPNSAATVIMCLQRCVLTQSGALLHLLIFFTLKVHRYEDELHLISSQNSINAYNSLKTKPPDKGTPFATAETAYGSKMALVSNYLQN